MSFVEFEVVVASREEEDERSIAIYFPAAFRRLAAPMLRPGTESGWVQILRYSHRVTKSDMPSKTAILALFATIRSYVAARSCAPST